MFVFPFRGDVLGLGQIQEVQLFANVRSKRFETADTRQLHFGDEPTAEAISVAVGPVDPDEPPGDLFTGAVMRNSRDSLGSTEGSIERSMTCPSEGTLSKSTNTLSPLR